MGRLSNLPVEVGTAVDWTFILKMAVHHSLILRNASSLARIGLHAVSYTHLDVYKRQERSLTVRFLFFMFVSAEESRLHK